MQRKPPTTPHHCGCTHSIIMPDEWNINSLFKFSAVFRHGQTPATCKQFSASVIHDVWIWLVSQRSKLPLIMAAAVERLLQHSRVKSNRNSGNLLHVKMFSAAGLDYMALS